MKHLKFFNESLSDKEIGNLAKQDLDDVLVYLKDEGYNAKVEVVMDYHAEIFLNLLDYQNKKVAVWKDIKDDIERCVDIVKGKFRPGTVYYKQVHPDGTVSHRNNRDTTSWVNFKNHTKDDTRLIFFSLHFSQVLPDGKSNYFY